MALGGPYSIFERLWVSYTERWTLGLGLVLDESYHEWPYIALLRIAADYIIADYFTLYELSAFIIVDVVYVDFVISSAAVCAALVVAVSSDVDCFGDFSGVVSQFFNGCLTLVDLCFTIPV